ncbi:NF-kappa-B essential modulator-like isoform X1 [Channa argus]|uniref:NF-kappa-B essential modulator-like isoform X1 n=1 Tax=Channa argus TaxID=215402 RepID=UPI0035221A96
MSRCCEELKKLEEENEFRHRFQMARVIVEKLLRERVFIQGLRRNGRDSSSNDHHRSRKSEDLQERRGALNAPQHVEGANEFLQLLKSHKQTMEEGMRDLRRKNAELERERNKGEKERLWMQCCIDQLLAQGGDLSRRLEEAERALALKQDLNDQLAQELERQKGSLETVPVLTAQVEIYKADFLAERAAREELNQKNMELRDQMNEALAEIERLKQEATICACMEHMMQRHLCFPTYAPHTPPPQGVFSSEAFNMGPPASSYSNQGLLPVREKGAATAERLPDFCCPKCQYEATDMDTLQIHLMDCIQ